jgi:hypothetical protein
MKGTIKEIIETGKEVSKASMRAMSSLIKDGMKVSRV